MPENKAPSDLAQFANRAWAYLLPFGIPKAHLDVKDLNSSILLNTFAEAERTANLILAVTSETERDFGRVLTHQLAFGIISREPADENAIIMLGDGQIVATIKLEGGDGRPVYRLYTRLRHSQ